MSSSQEINRSCELDVVRCVANYMIVFLHAWAAFQYVQWDTVEFWSWTFICSHLCGLAMPTFFMISGYLLFQHYCLMKWPKKIQRRVRRLVVPYLVWNSLFVVFYLSLSRIVPRLGTRVSTFGLDSFSGALSKIASFVEGPIDGPLWFLRAIFYFAVLSPIFYGLVRVVTWWGVLAGALIWLVAESMLGLANALHLTIPAYALVCFLAGGALANRGESLVQFFRNPIWAIVGVAACVCRAAILMPTAMTGESHTVMANIAVSLCLVLEAPVLLWCANLMPSERIARSSLYGFFKQMSFFAYAGHFLFCSMWLHVCAPLASGMKIGKMTLLISIFVVGGGGPMALVYTIMRRFLPRTTKMFDGTL